MAQQWGSLRVDNVTELKNHSSYNTGAKYENCIKVWENQIKNFVTYMPDSGGTVSATTMIKFHDCYQANSDKKGYAHATFVFNSPGYIAAFPISYGFVSTDKSGTLRKIGEKQIITRNTDTARTYWECTLETSFTWPSAPRGIIPYIAVGGHPVHQRYNATSTSGTIKYYTAWNNTTYGSYSGNVPVISSAKTGAADFAGNCFDMSVTGVWGNVVCPYVFSNWKDVATSTFFGGWGTRGTDATGIDGTNGHYVGAGYVFCGDSSYTTSPTYSTSTFQTGMKVWVYDSTGKPQRAKDVYVYDSAGKPQRAKHLYVYDSSGKPVQVF